MDHDAPEPEVLDLEETLTCCRVSAIYLSRAVDRAAEAIGRFVEEIRSLMDDMEPCKD